MRVASIVFLKVTKVVSYGGSSINQCFVSLLIGGHCKINNIVIVTIEKACSVNKLLVLLKACSVKKLLVVVRDY